MSVFEFILVLESIIVGLGIAELLVGTGRILRRELQPGALHSLWILIVFVLQVQFLWASWDLVTLDEWHILEFFLDLGGPICLYLIAASLFPAEASGESLDEFLLEKGTPVFLLLAITMVFYGLNNWVVYDTGLTMEDAHRAGVIGAAVGLALFRQRTIQWLLASLIMADVVVFAIVFTPSVTVAP